MNLQLNDEKKKLEGMSPLSVIRVILTLLNEYCYKINLGESG